MLGQETKSGFPLLELACLFTKPWNQKIIGSCGEKDKMAMLNCQRQVGLVNVTDSKAKGVIRTS